MATFLLVGLLSISAAGGLVWADLTGHLTSFGSQTLQTQQLTEAKAQIAAQADWNQGQYQGTAFDGTVLRLMSSATPMQPINPSKVLSSTDSVNLTPQSKGTCTSVAPQDWVMQTLAPPLSAFCYLYQPGADLFAGRFIHTVNAGIAANIAIGLGDSSLYGMFNSSSTTEAIRMHVHFHLAYPDPGTITPDYGTVAWTNDYNQQIGSYTLRSFETPTTKGVVFYLTDQVPASDGYSAIEFYNLAFGPKTTWATNGIKTARVAADTKVNAVFTPQKTDLSASDIPKDKTTKDSAGNDVTDAGYNVQLGTEEVHNPSTGTNYLVNPSMDWSSDGPNGPGYYIKNGNDIIHLEAGRVD